MNFQQFKKGISLLLCSLFAIIGFCGCSFYYATDDNVKTTSSSTVSQTDDNVKTTSSTVSQTEEEETDEVESIDVDSLYEDNSDYESGDIVIEPIESEASVTKYAFRNNNLLNQHFEKHNGDFGYSTTEEYVKGANLVINNPNSLHKLEAEDGDDVYYLEETNEFVVVSTDGYIRTYFKPSSGISYFNRQ